MRNDFSNELCDYGITFRYENKYSDSTKEIMP